MSRKSWPVFHSKSLYKMGLDFLDKQYIMHKNSKSVARINKACTLVQHLKLRTIPIYNFKENKMAKWRCFFSLNFLPSLASLRHGSYIRWRLRICCARMVEIKCLREKKYSIFVCSRAKKYKHVFICYEFMLSFFVIPWR